jgi:Rrf2 family protein
MLSLSRKTDYALVAMADLARRSPATVSARDMAKRLNMPLPVLQNILTQLMHQEFVVSVRGSRGGYQLRRPADQINIAELIEAVGGPVRLALCCDEGKTARDEEECHMGDVCGIREPIRQLHTLLRQCLMKITLEQVTWNRVPTETPMALESAGSLVQLGWLGDKSETSHENGFEAFKSRSNI